jgi:antitoxin PrlF
MKAIVSEKGQITIPKPLRMRLGIRKGQVLEVSENRGRVVLAKKDVQSPFDRAYGILKLGRTTDEIMEELRGRRPR